MVDAAPPPAARRRARSLPPRRQRGSVLIITLVFTVMLAAVAASVLELSANSYRLGMRNQLRAQARAVGESEMEYLFYTFKSYVLAGNPANLVPAIAGAPWDVVDVPTTDRTPFLNTHEDQGWTVRRSLVLDRGPIPGTIPGTTKVGNFTYLIARIEVVPPATNPFRGVTTVRIGRRIINSNTTIFQYSIFFQGDLELNPGTDTIINGDVVANGSIYMGPVSGRSLTLNGKVRYLADHFFNKTSGGATTYSNPIAPAPPVVLVSPLFGTSEDEQLETNTSPENILGGIDATATAKNREDLFGPASRTDSDDWSAAELAEAENNVYRSLIVPPPTAATSSEYPNSPTTDDSVISVRRAYSRAGLIIDVATDGTTSYTKIQDGVATDVTALFSSVATDFDTDPDPAATDYTQDVYDYREGKDVTITEIDIGTLKSTLDTLAALPAASADHFEFNGLLYVNLRSSSSSAPAAVRLINAADLPRNDNVGFSVATNGGIYVKGDYNTSDIVNPDATTRHVPAMLIGDAITLLSSSWSDANAASALSSRIATPGTTTLNAGLLTGNHASTGSASSGGAQNLVRYLENWTGCTVNFNGSIGRLFQSTQMTAPYGGAGTVYLFPNRNFDFDEDMPKNPPPGTPTTTEFGRGDFFTW